ncbi:MAG: hypothetical protein EPN30_06960 [Actinomycetota bacterium]|nr:MAG: hypothetical protein EPN30_06960 [Actinomycetota bacterium]
MIKVLHTSDWQLGMTRAFLSPESQARFAEARLEAIRTIARIAHEEMCDCVVVAGDTFESNAVDRKTIARALDALAEFGETPVVILPGNHDCLDASSVYSSKAWNEGCTPNVVVLHDCQPIEIQGAGGSLEIIGAPWDNKRPLSDLVSEACQGLDEGDKIRIVLGHGSIDTLSPDPNDPALISLSLMEQAIRARSVHYFALGDRHSTTEVGGTGRIWFSGTPLQTDYDEIEPNKALVIELDQDRITVEPRLVGTWSFLRKRIDLNSGEDVVALEQWLSELPAKTTTIVRLGLVGTLSLTEKAKLDAILEDAESRLAALTISERRSDLVVAPDTIDINALNLSGFARLAFEDLQEQATSADSAAQTAQDALGLMFRLSGRY